ncbi:hypothetical protein [Streptomyces niveus]|uniref:hypothetical protein n=1 Tax=Streptomyces niveus TaxID=193462 RepID=UPI0036D40E99
MVDDFLPADLRVPTRDEVEGIMMRRQMPLVIDGESTPAPQCASYCDWIVVTLGDEVRLRCRADHQAPEPRLDVAWFNRNSRPNEARHASFEEDLRHLGHLDSYPPHLSPWPATTAQGAALPSPFTTPGGTHAPPHSIHRRPRPHRPHDPAGLLPQPGTRHYLRLGFRRTAAGRQERREAEHRTHGVGAAA